MIKPVSLGSPDRFLFEKNCDFKQGIQGTNDYWIIKTDSNGVKQWDIRFGGNDDDDLFGIQQTADGGYIVAGHSFSSASGDVTGTNHGGPDCWIIKLDASGNITWNKLLGGNNGDVANCIRQTTDGGYIIAGQSLSSANGDVTATNHGGVDYWIVKLNASGTISWNKLLGGTNDEKATSIQQTADGGYIIAGYSLSSANGDISGINHGSNDYWVVKLDATGNMSWNQLLGGNGDDQGISIFQTINGNYIVGGYSTSSASGNVLGTNHGNYDYLLFRLDANGNIIR